MNEPDPSQNRSEKEIFFEALDKNTPEERAAFLDGACGRDMARRARVEALLADHFQQDAFMKKAAVEGARPTMRISPVIEEAAGTVIGRYKLLQQIGEGGCGVVYMAEQHEPVRRRIALKVIKLGMDTKQVVARFEAERQALALMDHSNIAKVFDAGATETGRPYFVMELVKGIPITRYCDENNLSTVTRLGLFIQVCQAIQHAHQKGIIHRDIKPSNVLVADHDGVPVPKIIDFGIAKATTDQPLTDKTMFTAFEQFIGTPAYMSPEQANLSGLDIDTRSDIYSLGVLLYELLTGKTPFEGKRLHEAGLDEIRRIIREEEPARPSTKLHTLDVAEQTTVANHRQSDPPKLAHLISGDLDWIVMKALEKDRGRRYETANGLAMDIQRHLGNEPIVARPPTSLYRFQKMVHRNKLVFAAASFAIMALVMGLGTSIWLYEREKDSRREAEFARAQEARAREQAQIGEWATQIQSFMEHRNITEADAMIRQVPVPLVSALFTNLQRSILRPLGEWNGCHQQWQRADFYFRTPTFWDVAPGELPERTEPLSKDLVMAAPVFVETGDKAAYATLRGTALACFGQTGTPFAAERTIMACLLLPADRPVLAQLSSLGDLVRNYAATHGSDPWPCLAIALLEYRQGHFSETAEWSGKALAMGDVPGGTAQAQLLLAMARYKLGQPDEAHQGIQMVQTKLNLIFGSDLTGSDCVYWHDWLAARLLLSEAAGLNEHASKLGEKPL